MSRVLPGPIRTSRDSCRASRVHTACSASASRRPRASTSVEVSPHSVSFSNIHVGGCRHWLDCGGRVHPTPPHRWLGSPVVRALDCPLDRREFDSRPPPLILGWVTIFGGGMGGQTTSVFHRATHANSASYPQRDGK